MGFARFTAAGVRIKCGAINLPPLAPLAPKFRKRINAKSSAPLKILFLAPLDFCAN